MRRDLELWPHQAAFIEDMTTKELALVGGRGCGKTYTLCIKLITLAFMQAGEVGAALSPTGPMASKVLIPEMLDALQRMRVRYKFNKSERKFEIFVGRKISTIYVLSAENVRDGLGLNLAFFGIDEADTMSAEDGFEAWRKLSGALRVGNPKYQQKVAVSTPEGYGFMQQNWVKNVTDDNRHQRRLIRGKSRDNLSLPPDFFADLEATYPAHYLAAYLDGEFVNMTSGSVYPDYDSDANHTNLTVDTLPDNVNTLHLGMDLNVLNEVTHPYGIFCTVSVVLNGQPYVIDEVYGHSRTSDMIDEIKRRYPGKRILVYPDATSQGDRTSATVSDRTQLIMAGFTDMSPLGNPRVKDRVNAVSAQILNGAGQRRMKINKNKCQILSMCLKQQAYDRKTGEPEKNTGYDDAVDALGYFVNVNWPVKLGEHVKVPLEV